jgi:hypothetical protein
VALAPHVGRELTYVAQPLDEARERYGEDMSRMLEFFCNARVRGRHRRLARSDA